MIKKIYHAFLFILQFLFYYLITPISYFSYHNKHQWIICERGKDARDNGYFFFIFLKKTHPEVNCYYMIKKTSADYEKIKKYGNVIEYKSLKHWLLYRSAECIISTHMLAGPGNYINEWFKRHKHNGLHIFVQHGITHNSFPSNYYENNGSDLFICGAKPEYEYISKECHYPKGNVVYTGFPRFDELHDFITSNQILLMPTWRTYLSNLSPDNFKKTKYFETFDKMLRNESLIKLLDENNLKLVFYNHYSFQQFTDCFNGYDNKIVIASFRDYDVQELLKSSKLLITDYSSVFFDFAYMNKPILYYQFDVKDFYEKHYKRCYFNHEKDGFGEVVYNELNLVENIKKIINNSFIVEDTYQKRVEHFFELNDTKNSERVYCEIIKKLKATSSL